MSGPGWEPQLRVRVGEAIRVVSTRSHMDFRGIAHQMVVVDTLGTLARSNICQDLGQPTVHAGVNEGGTTGVVSTSCDRDGMGCAAFVVVEGATGNTAIGNMRCHKRFLRIRLPGLDSVLPPTVGPIGPIKKTQLCDVIPPGSRPFCGVRLRSRPPGGTSATSPG